MKSRELLNNVMQDLGMEEEREINGGSRAAGAAMIYGAIMNGLGHSCSSDWFALNAGSGPSGSCVCTHR